MKEYPPPLEKKHFPSKNKVPAARNKYSGKGKGKGPLPCNISDKKFQSSKRSTVSIETALMSLRRLAPPACYYVLSNYESLCFALRYLNFQLHDD